MRGAFTGAVARKEGRFERAHGGTLFLDEVGELSPPRAGEAPPRAPRGRVRRVGGLEELTVDVRVVAATNQGPLGESVAEGRFREDLFYRINVIPIVLPPLRERREDIPLLADHFLRRFAAKNSKDVRGFAPETAEISENYAWPGQCP